MLFLDEHTDIPALARAIIIRQQARAHEMNTLHNSEVCRTARQQIEPNPRVATGPTGQTVVLLGEGVAFCTWRGVQDALELMQAQSAGRVSL